MTPAGPTTTVLDPQGRMFMSDLNHSILARLSRLAIGAVSTVALATGSYALTPIAPAQAATTFEDCTVSPTVPTASDDVGPNGETMVDYRGGVYCAAGLTAEVEREQWEQDLGAPDQKIRYTKSVVRAPLWWEDDALPDTDGPADDDEEVYQRVRFRVISGGLHPVTSPWTAWELTSAVAIRQ